MTLLSGESASVSATTSCLTLAATPADTSRRWLAAVAEGLRERRLAPYLGPGLLTLAQGSSVPHSYGALAAFFASKVPLPKRVRGNPWSAAQYIESSRHRSTLTTLMKAAFAEEVVPLPFHQALADWAPPLIVDTWYDATSRRAFVGREGWAELQGITRATLNEQRWFRAYGPAGEDMSIETASAAKSILYKPHGSVLPAANFLVSDSDYVEVLTEIDIQTPIPEVVRERRSDLGFVFIGCRFHDQMLRAFARQILKRSKGPHFAVFDHDDLTRMEQRLMAELHIDVLFCPLAEAAQGIVRG